MHQREATRSRREQVRVARSREGRVGRWQRRAYAAGLIGSAVRERIPAPEQRFPKPRVDLVGKYQSTQFTYRLVIECFEGLNTVNAVLHA